MPAAGFTIKLRGLRSADVPAVARFLPNRVIDAQGRSIEFDAVAACESLLDDGVMKGALFTTIQDGVETPAAVGGAFFVTEEFMQAIKTSSQPGVSARVLRSAAQRDPGVLSPPAIRRANQSEGLNVALVLHEWDRAAASDEFAREIRMRLVKGFLDDFRGYRLREVLGEVRGEEELQWALAGGYMLRDSYDEWYRTRTEPSPRHYLVSITREEALAREASVMSLLFHYREPACGFTLSERRLLQAALTLQTDAEIASALEISVSAVKKRWAVIFNRVADRIPELIDASPRELTRGPQKRHKLLAHLREHPEELRP
jgi:hypothetical protein